MSLLRAGVRGPVGIIWGAFLRLDAELVLSWPKSSSEKGWLSGKIKISKSG